MNIDPLLRLSGKRLSVVVDPGHGGEDDGYCAGGICEKDVALEAALILRDNLQMDGVDVHMTREEDKTLDLDERLFFTASAAPDLFVSLHCARAISGNEFGTRVFFHDAADSKPAYWIFYKMVENRGARSPWSKWGFAQDAIIGRVKSPSILICLGFIGGANHWLLKDEDFLGELMGELASAIVEMAPKPKAKKKSTRKKDNEAPV